MKVVSYLKFCLARNFVSKYFVLYFPFPILSSFWFWKSSLSSHNKRFSSSPYINSKSMFFWLHLLLYNSFNNRLSVSFQEVNKQFKLVSGRGATAFYRKSCPSSAQKGWRKLQKIERAFCFCLKTAGFNPLEVVIWQALQNKNNLPTFSLEFYSTISGPVTAHNKKLVIILNDAHI